LSYVSIYRLSISDRYIEPLCGWNVKFGEVQGQA
jgi:hypothetical protein